MAPEKKSRIRLKKSLTCFRHLTYHFDYRLGFTPEGKLHFTSSMKKKSTSKSAFFNLRVLIASVLCLVGIFVAMLGMGAFSKVFAQTRGAQTNQDAPGTQTPDV